MRINHFGMGTCMGGGGGEYFVSLIVVDKFENRSIPFTRQITVANDFAAEIPRLPLMLPLGGFSNALSRSDSED